jgi:hypothetical protein
MLYNKEYAKEALAEFMGQFDDDYEAGAYSVSIDGDINRIPVLDICRFFTESGDRKYQDDMIRLGILGKMVTILFDGDPVGSFQMNNITDPWEVFPPMNEHPLAHNALEDCVLGYIAKKATLPRKKGAGTAKAAAN